MSAARTSKSSPCGTSSGPGTASSPCVRRSAAASTSSAIRDEVGERLVAVLARAEVHLRHPLEPDGALGVDQHRDLDAVADREREPLQQLARRRDLARERLAEAGELGEVQVQVGAGEQLGDAAAAVGVGRVADPQRAPEVALDERDAARSAAGRAGRARTRR